MLYQLRLKLTPDTAAALRAGDEHPALAPLRQALRAHGATAVNTLDGFERYVAEAGGGADPLAAWTRSVLADPARRAKHETGFALHVGDAAIYPAETADALEAALAPLLGAGAVTALTRHDTDPAHNPQIPPRFRA